MERDEFYQLLVSLELLPSPGDASLPFPIEASTAFTTSTVEATAVHSSELSSCRPVSCDPKASRSQLARRTLALLKSETNCDLEFVLPTECDGATRSTPGHIIRAHRVVVSARCCWFRQALLSGMREAIDRWGGLVIPSPLLVETLWRPEKIWNTIKCLQTEIPVRFTY